MLQPGGGHFKPDFETGDLGFRHDMRDIGCAAQLCTSGASLGQSRGPGREPIPGEKCAGGALAGLHRPEVAHLWRAFLSSPLEMGAWHLTFLSLVGVISAGGMSRSIELATKLRAPILLILLVVLAAYALAPGDARAGLRFAFAPNIAAITPQVVLAAIGQAFYATGVGAAMMLAYGLIVTGSILAGFALGHIDHLPAGLPVRDESDPRPGPRVRRASHSLRRDAGGTTGGHIVFMLLVFAALGAFSCAILKSETASFGPSPIRMSRSSPLRRQRGSMPPDCVGDGICR
jgi:hypothetical protein